jgi:ArsR family transcriptional regulator
MHMKESVRLLKTLADETRLRVLMLLREKELFVCQLMAVTGLSQPLVSRSLSLLEREGLLVSRRQGKHVFYRLKGEVPALGRAVMDALAGQGERYMNFVQDRKNLELFRKRFQRSQTCDMSMVREFIVFKNKSTAKGA